MSLKEYDLDCDIKLHNINFIDTSNEEPCFTTEYVCNI